MGIEKEVEIWYAMRATYRREPDAMYLLKKENLGCFIPMPVSYTHLTLPTMM